MLDEICQMVRPWRLQGFFSRSRALLWIDVAKAISTTFWWQCSIAHFVGWWPAQEGHPGPGEFLSLGAQQEKKIKSVFFKR